MSSDSNFDNGASLVLNRIANIVKRSSGKISIKIQDKTAVELDFEGDNLAVNIVEPNILGMAEELSGNAGLIEKLKTARAVAEVLNNKGLSVSILRKGKKALSIGRGATPTISSLVTGSDDIQVDSIIQVAKLDRDIKKANQDSK
ncbi:MAG TPA: hypothetical protein VJS91_03875 [Nitrososphaeraceae archaeon]|nr:hypothetical protein [Nitrososphaeraceae archaeon]